MQINISLPFIFNIYLVITFIHIISTAVADPDVNLPKVEFTSKKQYVAIASPVFVATLLIFVSGIPLIEKSSELKFGHLRDYQE